MMVAIEFDEVYCFRIFDGWSLVVFICFCLYLYSWLAQSICNELTVVSIGRVANLKCFQSFCGAEAFRADIDVDALTNDDEYADVWIDMQSYKGGPTRACLGPLGLRRKVKEENGNHTHRLNNVIISYA